MIYHVLDNIVKKAMKKTNLHFFYCYDLVRYKESIVEILQYNNIGKFKTL